MSVGPIISSEVVRRRCPQHATPPARKRRRPNGAWPARRALRRLTLRHRVRTTLRLSPQGLRAVDLGAGCWSMHSIRETVGVADVDNSFVLFRTFFASFAELDAKCRFGLPKVCPPCGKKASV